MSVSPPQGLDVFVGAPVRAGALIAEYRIGDAVRFGTIPFDEADIGLVTGVTALPGGFLFTVMWPRGSDSHYAFELAPAPEDR